MLKRRASGVTLALLALAVVAISAGAASSSGTFADDDGNVHEANIELIAIEGITVGCDGTGTLYCPADNVTRGQMAAFIVRALGLVNTNTGNMFTDDDGSNFEDDIEAMQAAGITLGCNAAGTEFCPNDNISRGQMAAFLSRAFKYTDVGAGDFFTDDDGSTFETEIDLIRFKGITLGCDGSGTLYCPDDPVRRDQMASFLARALNLGGPPPPPPPPPGSTTTMGTTTTSTTVPDGDFTWAINAVPSGDDLGIDIDMVVTGGRAAISTRADGANSPAYVLCQNAACSTVESSKILTGPNVAGISTSIQVINGQPVIASEALTQKALRVTLCTDLICTAWGNEDPPSSGGGESSMVTINGLPVIGSFASEVDGGSIDIVACDDIACTSSTATQVATNVGPVTQTSMAVVGGLPAIAYWNSSRDDLEYILCLTVDCSSRVSNRVDGAAGEVGRGVDLTVIGGFPVMSYQDADNGTAVIARCVDTLCSVASINDVAGSSNVGTFTSIVGGPDGYAWVAFYDVAGTSLEFANCENLTCSDVDFSTVDGAAGGDAVGRYMVIVNIDDRPLIAYRDDGTNPGLKTAYGG